MLIEWFIVVFALSPSSAAISLFEAPVASNASTSRSRLVSFVPDGLDAAGRASSASGALSSDPGNVAATRAA